MSNGIKYQFQPLGDEYQFELFIKDLFNAKYNTHSFQTYKGRGATQHGIDVYSTEVKVFVQCKKKDLSRSKDVLQKELQNDFEESLEMLIGLPYIDAKDSSFTFILASTAKRYNLQDTAGLLAQKHQLPDAKPKLKDVQYLGWEAIEELLNDLPAIHAKYYPGYVPKDLTTIPPIDKNEVVGRDKDLESIKELIKADRPLLLVNGLGGIGKTTLAKYYVQDAYANYDHVAWITMSEDLPSAFLSNPLLLKRLGLASPSEEERKYIVDICCAKLKELPGDNLLVIDNATQSIEAYSAQLGSLSKWKVLLTSREELKRLKANPYRLDVLDWEDAMKLFREHYLLETVQDDDLKKVLTLIGRHTMIIKILAKTFEAAGRTFAQMRERLESKGLKFSLIQTDDPDYQIWDAQKKAMVHIEQANIDQWVKTIFTWDEATMTQDEETILMYFSVLPSYNYGIEFLVGLFQKFEEPEREQLINILNSLANKGWIDKIANDSITYKCHAVVQHAVREKTRPNWENCMVVIRSVITLIRIDETQDNPVDKFPFAELADSLLQYIEGNKGNRSLLLNEAGLLQQHLGDYSKAKSLLESALSMGIKEHGEDHPDVAASRSNLALVYQDLGNFEKARELLDAALNSNLNHFGEDHPIIATTRSNLAVVYQDLGYFEKARELLETALDSDIKHFGEQHPKVATLRSNLAVVYRNLGKFEKARELLEAALDSDLKHFGELHPNIARCNSNLAQVYKSLGDFKKAQELLKVALSSDIRHFGVMHSNVATDYNNLGLLQLKLGLFDEGIESLLKAHEICLQCWGSEHPNTKSVASALQQIWNLVQAQQPNDTHQP